MARRAPFAGIYMILSHKMARRAPFGGTNIILSHTMARRAPFAGANIDIRLRLSICNEMKYKELHLRVFLAQYV